MNKKVVAFACCLALIAAVSACKKKEEPVPRVPFQPIPQSPMQPAPQAPMPGAMSMGETKVVVPKAVKGKWSAVKLIVLDKTTNKSQEYTVNLNSDFKIPNSNLKVRVGEFLPDFRKEGLTLTSASNNLNNPAVEIKVYENNKQIFPTTGKKWGWLFSKMPSVHPLRHPRYNIMLKEGIAKKG